MKAAAFFIGLISLGGFAWGESLELYRIRLSNQKGGTVEVSQDGGRHYEKVGQVLLPARVASTKIYKAAAFARPKRVVATAVNAIHIGLPDETGEAVGSLFSILPREFSLPPKDYYSFLNTSSSVITDIRAGESIFGGGFAPFVGSEVFVGDPSRPLEKMLRLGETLYIKVCIEPPFPTRIEFENKFGGRVTLFVPGEKPQVIAQVLRPVQGVGRFLGTLYTAKGRVRANHSGVIDISTSPFGQIGGFQIIPSVHAMGEDILNARLLTQWMVVGPTSVFGKPLEGTFPLFYGALHPDYRPDDLFSREWKKRLLQRSLVQARMDNGNWQPIPEIVGRDDRALLHLTHLRIWLSQYANEKDLSISVLPML